jgi:hypothetical protein
MPRVFHSDALIDKSLLRSFALSRLRHLMTIAIASAQMQVPAAMAAHAAWGASCQGGNKRTNTDNKIIGIISTIPAANKPSRSRIGGR